MTDLLIGDRIVPSPLAADATELHFDDPSLRLHQGTPWLNDWLKARHDIDARETGAQTRRRFSASSSGCSATTASCSARRDRAKRGSLCTCCAPSSWRDAPPWSSTTRRTLPGRRRRSAGSAGWTTRTSPCYGPPTPTRPCPAGTLFRCPWRTWTRPWTASCRRCGRTRARGATGWTRCCATPPRSSRRRDCPRWNSSASSSGRTTARVCSGRPGARPPGPNTRSSTSTSATSTPRWARRTRPSRRCPSSPT